MCLHIHHKHRERPVPLIAEIDIICYKCLLDNVDFLSSYYMEFQYSLGKVYTVNDFGERSHCISEDDITFYNGGGFHSFVLREGADKFISRVKGDDIDNCVIVRCRIPKGSRYLEGGDFDDRPNYYSESIIIDEIIK